MVSLLDVTVSLLCFAVAGLHALDYLLPISPSNQASALVLLALLTAYFTGVILVYLQTATARVPPVSTVALRLLAAMACVLLLLVAIMPLAPWLLSM